MLHQGFGQQVGQIATGKRVGQFQQNVPWRIGRRRNTAVFGRQLQSKAADQFKTAQAFGKAFPNQGQQFYRLPDTVHAHPSRFAAFRQGKQFQRGCGDDAQRAFAADKQLAQVVARGVLVQRMQVRNQFAVRQHHFQTHYQITHRAVTQHVQPARIAGDIAADLARSFAGQAERKKPTRTFRRLLHVMQHAARFNGNRIVSRTDAADAVQTAQIQQNAATRNSRAAESGIAALRGNGDTVLETKTHDGLHCLHALRLQRQIGRSGIAAALVDQQACRLGQNFLRLQQGGKLLVNSRHNI